MLRLGFHKAGRVLGPILAWFSLGAGLQAAPVEADRIAQLPDETRAEWEAYWDRSQKLRAADEMRIQAELRELGDGAKWRPAPTNRRIPRHLRNPDPKWCASEEARTMAKNILSFQTPAGGWCKNVPVWSLVRETGMGFGENRAHYRGTFDNNATTVPLRILGWIASAQDWKPAREGFLKGVDYVLKAQYPSGGWPQVYPLEGGYHDHVTFNDGAMVNILEFLHELADGGYPFVDKDLRDQVRKAIDEGESFILRSQIEQDGVKTVWCAQHDPLTLRPANARSYEWASLSGAESAGVVIYLMDHAEPTPEVRRSVDAAHAWFEKNVIYGKRFRMRQLELVDQKDAGPLWARFYELDSGRPMFVARNADKAVYSVDELPPESNGYAWYSNAGASVLDRYPKWKAGKESGGN